MAAQDAQAKLDAAYHAHMDSKRWEQAAQNRMGAAAFARTSGRSDLLRTYADQAIDLARSNALRRLELNCRITRFQLLLGQDLDGRTRDEVRQQLDYSSKLTGKLSSLLDEYCAASFSSHAAVLDSLEQADGRALDLPALADVVGAAAKQATAFSMARTTGQYEDCLGQLREGKPATDLVPQLRMIAEHALVEANRVYVSLRTQQLLLAAEFKQSLGDGWTPPDILTKAEEVARSLPDSLLSVYTARADLEDSLGHLQAAIDYAEKAMQVAQKVSSAVLRAQAAAKRDGLLAKQSPKAPPQPKPKLELGAMERAAVHLGSANRALLDKRFVDALAACEEGLHEATTPRSRLMVIQMRALAFYELDRLQEAEADIDVAISLLAEELASDKAVSAGALDDRIILEEGLHLMKGWVKARSGQYADAWDTAEKGRSTSLKREIAASAGEQKQVPGDTDFATVRDWLAAEQAAILSLASLRWGTLALSAGPGDAEPQAKPLEGFTSGKLNELLAPKEGMDSLAWTNKIFGNIEALSVGLMQPLRDRILDLSQRSRVLYIIPSSWLYCAPFAALEIESGKPLVEISPVAIAPSIGILLWGASRRGATADRSCLAVAVGKDDSGFEFHNHLRQIETAFRPAAPHELQDDAATVENVSTQAPNYEVLYFSCHGIVSSEVRDIMAASRLELAGKKYLTARDVLGWKLRAQLVFLNACQSGRFRPGAPSEVSGFLRAFLLAGARSLVAPLTHVVPRAAGDLAEIFFQHFLKGESSAQALRQAQVALKRRGLKPQDWAAHLLIGTGT
jgi:hypothetical protein